MRPGSGVAPDGSPVALYLALPGEAEAAFIRASVPGGSSILELGCGAGRVTRHLVAAGHAVTAVDNSSEMLDELSALKGVEIVLADIADLDLAPRRWLVVLLASHLINDENGGCFLASASRHVAADGCVLIQRHEPGWIDTVDQATSRRPGLTIDMHDILRPCAGVMSATMVYEIGERRFEQPFTAHEVDDSRLAELADSVGLEVTEVLDEHRTWVRLRPRA